MPKSRSKIRRDTKIIATLGPASDDDTMLEKMAQRGVDVARINFSHGTYTQYKKFFKLVDKVNKRGGFDIKLLQDLAGYRIRIGELQKNKELKKDDTVYVANAKEAGKDHIPFDFEQDIKTIEKGAQLFIDDGRIHLKVTGYSGKKLKCKVLQGGVLKEKKGVNIPTLKLKLDEMTEQDRKDLEFGLKHDFAFIAQSFVRHRKDIQRVVERVRPQKPECKVIAKIESLEGVKHIDGILDACDGVMVARGDLGVTAPIYKIPMIQKYIIGRCSRKKKIAITATQMLDSMITNGRPTRAEVTDIANAILDGTDYVMLSGETAVGKYPSRSVQMMRQIIEYTEKCEDYRP